MQRRLELFFIVLVRRGGDGVDGRHRFANGGLGFGRPVPSGIVKGTHSVFKPPVGHQGIGRLVVGHAVPTTVQHMAEPATGHLEFQQAIKQGFAVCCDKASVLGGVNSQRGDGDDDLRDALHVVGVP